MPPKNRSKTKTKPRSRSRSRSSSPKEKGKTVVLRSSSPKEKGKTVVSKKFKKICTNISTTTGKKIRYNTSRDDEEEVDPNLLLLEFPKIKGDGIDTFCFDKTEAAHLLTPYHHPGTIQDVPRNPWTRQVLTQEHKTKIQNFLNDKNIKKVKDLDNPDSPEDTEDFEETLIAKVRQDPSFVQTIQNPSERVQYAVIENNIENIRFIENPSEQLQMNIIRKDPDNIRFIENPSEQLQLAAIEEDINSVVFIKKPCYKVLQQVLDEVNYSDLWEYKGVRELLDHINIREDGSLVYNEDNEELRELEEEWHRKCWKGDCSPLLKTLILNARF